MEPFDAIVLGAGGVGSAALYHLARRGLRVLGLDRFPTAHANGSSHGQTRLIRQAYFEHPDYVPLLKRAYRLWEDLAATCHENLYREVGVLQAGLPDGRILPGVLASAREHQLEVEPLGPAEVQKRFPGFVIPENLAAVFERRAGFLMVEDCIRAHTRLAQQHGAMLRTGETVLSWSASPSNVQVTTDHGRYSAGHLIITAGSWANDFLGSLGIPLEVVRKSLYWYETASPVYRADRGAPGFIIELPTGNFYGFPQIDTSGLKVAEHSGGEPVGNPLQFDRTELPHETNRVTDFLRTCLPDVTHTQTKFDVCLYTLSADRNFIVDRHPDYPHVSFAAGLSGHGFKFASVLGEVLGELALGLAPSAPVDFLSCHRPGIRGA